MKLRALLTPLLILAAHTITPSSVGEETAWPQWRGPERNGHTTGPRWPDDLSENELRQSWRVELGPSYSGPVVNDKAVFTTETVSKDIEAARAYDRKTGQLLWSKEWKGGTTVPFFAKANGDWIRATPALDGDRLFVAGMRDLLICLDTATGAELWRIDFVERLDAPEPDFGFVSSPLVDGNHVYVQAGASFVKIHKDNGTIVWQSLHDGGGMMGSAFSSPVIETIAGHRQLVVQTRDKLVGIDSSDGRTLWEQPVKAFRGMNILTPTVHEDVIFTSTYGGRTTGYQVNEADDKYTVSEQWQHKSQGYMSTPVVINRIAYHHLKSQRMMAIDMATGDELWTSGDSFGKYMSFVARDDRFLALDQDGTLYLIAANPSKLHIIDTRTVSTDETWAHLAVVDDQLFIREQDALTTWEWSSTPH